MPTRNVNLTEHFDRFIETGITSGRFSNASEVRADLRLLEQHEREDQAKLEWLRAAAKESFDAIDRGEGIEFESMDDLEAYIHQIGEEVSAEIAAESERALRNAVVRKLSFPPMPGPILRDGDHDRGNLQDCARRVHNPLHFIIYRAAEPW